MHVRLARPLALAASVLLPACSSGANGSSASADPCTALDLTSPEQATVKAYADAASALRSSLGAIEDRVFHVCDAMNATLALARPRNTYDACSTFRARVDAERTAGASIALQLDASCMVDSTAGDRCSSLCQPGAVPCQSACDAVAEAGVVCSVNTTPVLSGVDDALSAAIAANATEWGSLESTTAELEATVTGLGPPLLDYAQTADVISKPEQDCYQGALANLGVALISFDASRDGLAALPKVASASP